MRTVCDLAHKVRIRGGVLQLSLILGLVALIFVVATVLVVAEDRRAARRVAQRRQARLASLGEVDPLAAQRLRQ
ncbi:hypothetical protein [Amycolatopsis sp. cmx-11-32]|uniref:hypothetical protein n=1 Tax=Amycolatopsis sp. cmx-11-32 TaxID=2785796 RepID=UPI0039E44C68